jgi:hypothetical protein
MSFFSKWFKGNKDIKQQITANSIQDSHVYQAGGDINVYHFPEEMLSKLVEIASKSTSIDAPHIIEPSNNLNLSTEAANELYGKLMENTISEIKSLYEDGRIENSGKMIEELMSTSGFDEIQNDYKIQLFYYKGLICLERGDKEGTQHYLSRIEEVESENKFFFILKSRIALNDDNSVVFFEAIDGLRKINHDSNDILVRIMNYELTQGHTETVISSLTELGVVKADFDNNPDALYYLGAAYLNENKFFDARKNLLSSDTLKPSRYKKFLIILSEIIPLLRRPGIIYLLSDDDKNKLRDCLEKLLSISDYFEEKSLEVKAEFWSYVLNIKLLLNPSEIIVDVEKFTKELREHERIQLMLAEAYSLVGVENRANDIYQALYNQDKNPRLLLKVLNKYYEQKEYHRITDFVNSLEEREFDEDGDIAAIYLLAFSKQNGFELAMVKFEELRQAFPNSIMLNTNASFVAFEHENNELAKTLIEKAISLISEDNDPVRFFIAKNCESIGLIEQAIKVLEPFKQYSVKASEMLVKLLLISEEPTRDEQAEQIVDELIQTGNASQNILHAKAEIALRRENISEALDPLITSHRINPSTYAAYNIVAVKLQLQQKEGFDEYITYLKDSHSPKAVMLAAVALDYLNNRGTAEELAYTALVSLGMEFDETIYMQYIMFYMQRGARARRDEVIIDFACVERDTVIQLISNTGENRFVCINSELNLITTEGFMAFGCEHYTHSSVVAIQLLRRSINDLVVLDGIEYVIGSVTNKRIHAFRYCLSRYTELCPESSIIKAISINSDDPISSLLPFLDSGKKNREFLLAQYNFENTIGLPIAALCEKNYSKYPSAILMIFDKSEQIFYAGDVNDFDINNQSIILSISSIIVLKTLNLLNKLEGFSERLYVPESLYAAIRNIFEDVSENEVNVSGTMHITDEGMPLYLPISDEQKQEKINYWRDVLLFLDKVNKISVNAESTMLNTAPIMNDFEIDTIEAGRQLSGLVICDDLFVRKVSNTIIGEGQTRNSIALLQSIIDENEMLNAIHFLSKVNYLFCFNAEVMYRLIEKLVSNVYLIGPGTKHEKLVQITNNVLAHPILFKEYLPILRDIIYRLYDKRYDVNISLIVKEFITAIKMASRRFGINQSIVLTFLSIPSGLDLIKANYIRDIFNQ